MDRRDAVSRRDALTAVGGVALTVSSFGAGSRRSGPTDGGVRVTVGYAGPAGERAARERAREVVYEFAFDALTVVVDAAAVEALRAHDAVRYVERDRRYEVAAQTLPWGIDRVDADLAHEDGHAGDGADVAILDTGIDRGHPDLADNLGEGVAFEGGVQTNNWQDDNGHGTHCAGIAAAVDDDGGVVGVAPSATLHAVKVLAAPGAGLSSDVAKGIEWVADKGYDVASMSISGERLESVGDACEYAARKGVLLVAAAGNEGPCRDCVRYPAAYPEVIAVSSTTKDDRLARSSSQGPEIELAAPGVEIYSTYLGGYATKSGTSMACPHVSGAAAQLAARGQSAGEIRRTLTESAEDVGLSSNESGAGLLDVAAALGVEEDGGGAESTPTEGEQTPTRERSTPTQTDRPPTATRTEPTGRTATSTPTGSPDGGAGVGGRAEVGGRTSTASPRPRSTGTPHADSGATATRPATARPARTRTAAPSPTAATTRTASDASGGGGSLWSAVGSALDAVADALAKLFS